jgi:cell division transport system permease protein
MTSFEKYQKRRLRLSYLSVVISITLVLFLLGLLGLLIFHTQNISNHFKEKYAISIFLNDNVKEKTIKSLQKTLDEKEYTKKTIYISKEQAIEIYKEDVGEDFMNFLGENPLKNGFDLFLKADFVFPDKMKNIEDELLKIKGIQEVSYDKAFISLLTNSVKSISFWLLVFSGLLSLIAIVLINSYLRLSIYAKRFTIKTMQMVGATKRFIRKPFLYRSVKLGMLGSILAIIILLFILYHFNNKFTDLGLLDDKLSLALLFLGIFIVGIFITWFSTFFATKRFLNLKQEELHY